MELNQREDIIRRCLVSSRIITKSYNTMMSIMRPKDENADFGESVADELTDHLYHIIKQTAITWPAEYDEDFDKLPFGLLFGQVTDQRIERDFYDAILRGKPAKRQSEYRTERQG